MCCGFLNFWNSQFARVEAVRDGFDEAILLDVDGYVAEGSGGTAVGQVLGTPEYMSPEQASGEPVDARSDIYSLGVVAYFILTGRLPFTGETVAAVLAQHITQPAPPLGSAVSPALARVVNRCIAKEPADRFQTAEAMAEAVEAAADRPRQLPAALERLGLTPSACD